LRVIWRAAARRDLVKILGHIADENPLAARQLARELVIAADSLSMFPRRGRPGLTPGTRELMIVRPYILIYEIDDDVAILRIWHSAQDRNA